MHRSLIYRDCTNLGGGGVSVDADVRRYDSDLISLHGSKGLLARVKSLLDTAPAPSGPGTGISEWEKRELLNDLVRIVRETEY